MSIDRLKEIEYQHSYENRLMYLKTGTLCGHGYKSGNPQSFDWALSASILDENKSNEVDVPPLKRELSKRTPFNWDFTLQLAGDQPLPPAFDYKTEVGHVQMLLLDAVDSIPAIAAEIGARPLKSLTNYGIPETEEGNLLKYLIYDQTNPNLRMVRSFRLDTVGGERITEAQVAMGGWASSLRIPLGQQLVGGGSKTSDALLELVQEATGNADPNIAMFVDEGVSVYWPEFCDFSFANGRLGRSNIYTVGNHGFEFKKRKLYYVNPHSGVSIPIDAVYTLADARRLLKPDCKPILTAARRGSVYIEPTLNPLLNNYHLVRGLLFHTDQYIEAVLLKAFSEAGSVDPVMHIEMVKRMTIPMSIVEIGNSIDLPDSSDNLPVIRIGWQEVLDKLTSGTENNGFLTKSVRKGLLIRTLLSPNLGALSGGFGSRQMDKFSVAELRTILEESCRGMFELRTQGKTEKRIVGVEPLIKHQPKTISVYDLLPDGSFREEEIVARHRFCPFYYRDRDGKAQLMSAISFYSSVKDATYKLGGRIYAQGAHY